MASFGRRTLSIFALLLAVATGAPAAAQEPAAIIVRQQPSVPLVSLRLSLLADDPPGYAGAGHFIQHLVYPQLSDRARRVGGSAQIERTADALVYTITGPAVELPYLSQTLLATLEVPAISADALLRVSRDLREERLAEWETAQGHIRSVLRSQLFPGDISAAGTDRSAARLSERRLPDVWAALYRPERVTVVAVGDVNPRDVQTAFSRLPAPLERPGVEVTRDSVYAAPLAPAEATRAWYGNAYLATEHSPAAVTVAARLLREQVQRRLPAAQVEAEHWWSHHGQGIALIGAAQGPALPDLRRAIDTSISELSRSLNFLRVVEAADATRHEMLFYSRTPERMAEIIGLFADRGADPNAAEAFFAALASVDDRDVREVLEDLQDATPIRVEVPPQVLRPRQR